uniref:Coat protein n=1 Tax=Leviviridae sp. TaxID=2027243 RepID=A0A514DC22_9VIRU|nr:MAG: hypothetical protein H1Bulk30639e312_000002 [Leviviridae sp.]
MPAIGQVKLSSKIDNTLARLTNDPAIGVTNTFDPVGIDANGVASYEDASGGIAVGNPRLSIQLRRPNKTNRNYKVTVKLFVPTLEVTSPSTGSGIQPAPTKAYDCVFVGEFILPERSTSTERVNLSKLVQSLFMGTINASDGSPTDSTGSPLNGMINSLAAVY